MAFSTVVGLAIMAGAVALFALLMPRGGRISPILRSDGVESALAMLFVLMLFTGGTLVLAGFPTGVLRGAP